MKLILVFFVLLMTSNQSNGQRFKINVTDKNLHEMLQEVHKETGINFSIQEGITKAIGLITYKSSKITLKQLLKRTINHEFYTFNIKGNFVQISYRKSPEKPPAEQVTDSTAFLELRGIVVDEENKPLAGATILLKSSRKAYVTGISGHFVVPKAAKRDILMISYIGYESKELPYNGNDFLRCTLSLKEQRLKTIDVDKGYYKDRKAISTGIVASIFAEDIERQPVSDPLYALSGRLPGVFVNQESGINGAAPDVTIQSINSLSNGTAPLYIVDGVPLNMTPLNQLPNAAGNLSSKELPPLGNIERIDILKDADATAIYGSRGANGVVLITTKKGSPGKTRLNVDVSSGEGKIARKQRLMNTKQYLEMRTEALKNDKAEAGLTDYDLKKWDANRYTDWQETFNGGNSKVLNARAALLGGSMQTQFSISGGYTRETSIFRSNFASITKSTDLSLTHVSDDKKLKADISLHYLNNDNQLPLTDITPRILLAPNAPSLYTPSGELNWENGTFENPAAELLQRYGAIFNHFLGSYRFSYKLLPRLMISANMGYNYIHLNEHLVIPLASMAPSLKEFSMLRSHSVGENSIKSWIVEPQVNYNWKFHPLHSVEALVGITFQESNQSSTLTKGTGFASDAFAQNIAMATKLSMSSDNNMYRYKGIYARLGYNYNDLLSVNLVGRNDGSSRFSAEKRSILFGSAGIAWQFSNTSLFKKYSFLSAGKVHASYGKTGNDQFSDYQFYDTYNVSTGYNGLLGLERTKLTNYLYSWEILIKSAIGIDFCINKKYTTSINYSINHTQNQLVKYDLPTFTGYAYTTANLKANIRSKILELEFLAKQIENKNFSWVSSFNITIPVNKLVAYPDFSSSVNSTIYAVGYPLDIRYVYKFSGINETTGIAEFADLNGDNKIDQEDRYPKFAGIKYYGGLGNTVACKGLTFSFLFQFVKQSGYYVASMETPGRFLAQGGNQPLSGINRWTKPGDISNNQKYSALDMDVRQGTNLMAQSDASIVDASYIRLKNLSISWDFPATLNSRLQTQSVRLYFIAQNLATWTPFRGMDPENQHYHVNYRQPPQTMFLMGIKIGL